VLRSQRRISGGRAGTFPCQVQSNRVKKTLSHARNVMRGVPVVSPVDKGIDLTPSVPDSGFSQSQGVLYILVESIFLGEIADLIDDPAAKQRGPESDLRHDSSIEMRERPLRAATFIANDDPARRRIGARILVQRVEEGAVASGGPEIVVIKKGNVLPGCVLQALVTCGRGPDCRAFQEGHPWCELCRYRIGRVGGIVVNDDELIAGKQLSKNRGDCLLEKILPVTNRNDDAGIHLVGHDQITPANLGEPYASARVTKVCPTKPSPWKVFFEKRVNGCPTCYPRCYPDPTTTKGQNKIGKKI
jgi:hypothetical protein